MRDLYTTPTYIDTDARHDAIRSRIMYVASRLGPMLADRQHPMNAAAQLARARKVAGDNLVEFVSADEGWTVAQYAQPYADEDRESVGRVEGATIVTPEGGLRAVYVVTPNPSETHLATGGVVAEIDETSMYIFDGAEAYSRFEPGDRIPSPHTTLAIAGQLNAFIGSLGIPAEAF